MASPSLSRRSLLIGATATGATAALRGFPGATSPPRIRKAVGLGMVQEGETLLDKFRLLQDLGYDGVELDAPNAYDTAELLAARDQTGLRIHGVVDSVHWAKPFSHPDPAIREAGTRGLERAIRAAAAYGAETVLVVPAVVSKTISYQQAWKRSRPAIASTLPLAEELGIKIAIENVWNNFLLSPLEMARYIDSFQSPAVGSYFDVGNVIRYGWPEQWIEVLGPRILRIHVKEYSRKKQNDEGLWKGFQVELLEGDDDWSAVVAALRKVGYQEWMTAEVGGGGAERLRDIATRMDRILAS